MSYIVSTATVDDLDHVAKLIDDYVRQNLNMPSWSCSIATFKRDYTSGCFRMTTNMSLLVSSDCVGSHIKYKNVSFAS